jgi:transcription antitermination factor NusB
MKKRSKAREIAIKLLYEVEISGAPRPSEVESILRRTSRDESVVRFAEALYRGVRTNWDYLSRKISSAVDHWAIDRIGAIERNILCLALYELCFLDDIPPKVSINEAVELAKKFGGKESAAFVNGILDRLWKETQTSNA